MSLPIDDVLTRALLRSTAEVDVVAAESRLAARLAGVDQGARQDAAGPRPDGTRPATGVADPGERTGGDLRTLCEALIARDGALSLLRDFLTRHILEPPGARVLGCVLQLAGHEDSAQFWWQFAAGAGDPAAAYCLYLHHMALGEVGQAHWWLAWWHQQVCAESPPVTDQRATDQEVAIALRVLRGLKGDRAVPPATGAVLAYVPGAVGFVDDVDLDLPLPEPGFASRIEDLTAAPAGGVQEGAGEPGEAAPPPCRPRSAVGRSGLPERRRPRPNCTCRT